MGIRYQLNEKDNRPWGSWEVITVGNKYIVKKIIVNPHSALSLQMHHHREEHWVFTLGKAMVTVGDERKELVSGQTAFIQKETKHRVENTTDEPVEFIEIQLGDTLDENDIVRFEDRYNRPTKSIVTKEAK
jgi:mannose-6-phosphate isomerase-like protein (cupin superfamily)